MTPGSEPAGFCPRCGYRTNPGVCPECGTAVLRPSTRDPSSTRCRLRRFAVRAIVAGAVLSGTCLFGWYAISHWCPLSQLERIARSQGRLAHWASHIISARHERERDEAETRLGEIAEEARACDTHPWAGSYERWGARFNIAPSGEYCFFSTTCGHIDAFELGRIQQTPLGRIRMRPIRVSEFGNGHDSIDFVRVRWGDRRYLVPTDDLAEFCKDVVEGYDFLGFPRSADLSKPLYGLPDVPAEYRRFLPAPPRQGRVTWLGPVSSQPAADKGEQQVKYSMKLRVDVGTLDGVQRGSHFFPWSHVPFQYLVAEEVEDHSSKLRYESRVYDDESFMHPTIGWIVCYRPELDEIDEEESP